MLRRDVRQARTEVISNIKHLLRCRNLQWRMPYKTLPTHASIAWLKKLALAAMDRLEMNHLLVERLTYFLIA